ncbi:antibiotic biosynthesis monooxygenase [Paenibacillus sp. BSR1-1]|uniref:putative quinol monooxygenase n=1 Tax=Paenibacillus sp. BSR1-1 TaxID=3020845 RepID=UPI0025B22D3A|nr:antibiotic biosynthesis monooxygenase [Paenibacillus sp. BSR1-1]MDN3020159.1 antibiotic biosynthesis monooxygenase [Paenibacillus sp. BSR1-1]
MFVRVVNIGCKAGMEEQLRQIGREVLVPINQDAGCVSVYFLEPSIENDNPFFGVVSIWRDKETLDTMKNSERYRAVLQDMDPLIESLTDFLYVADIKSILLTE